MRYFSLLLFPILLAAQGFEFNAYTTIKELRFFKDLKEFGNGKPYEECIKNKGLEDTLKTKQTINYDEISECITSKFAGKSKGEGQYAEKDLIDLFKNQYQIDYYVGQNKLDGNKEYLLRENIKNMITRNLQTQNKEFSDLSSVSRVDQLKIFKELAKKNRDLYFSEFCLLNKKASGAKTHEDKIVEALQGLTPKEQEASLGKCREILKKDVCNKKTVSTKSQEGLDKDLLRACKYKEVINKYSSAILKVQDSIDKLSAGEDDPKMVLNSLKSEIKIDHSKITDIDGSKSDQIEKLLEGNNKDHFEKLASELDKSCVNIKSKECKKILNTGDVEQYNQLQLKISLEAAKNRALIQNEEDDKKLKDFVVGNNYYTEEEFEKLKKDNPNKFKNILINYFENRKNSLINDLNEKFGNRVTTENDTNIDNIKKFIRDKKVTMQSIFKYNEATKTLVKNYKKSDQKTINRDKKARDIGSSAPQVDLDDFYIDIFSN